MKPKQALSYTLLCLLTAGSLTAAGCFGGASSSAPAATVASGSPAGSPAGTPAAVSPAGSPSPALATAAATTAPKGSPKASSKPTSAPSAATPAAAERTSLSVTVKTVGGKPVVTNPESAAVVVNKSRALPDQYAPTDLVYPQVPFTFNEKVDKRKLRKEAARALEALFQLAEKDGIKLAGVSGYRSYATQVSVYNGNVKNQGKEAADKVSAKPGYSEHQTGLAIDVSAASVQYALEAEFGDTKEGQWLAAHAHEAGFIIRYPLGKESVTGYSYEPWHIRYVGKAIAKELYDRKETLEEYFQDTVPVNAP